jgi:hypothetical protein
MQRRALKSDERYPERARARINLLQESLDARLALRNL